MGKTNKSIVVLIAVILAISSLTLVGTVNSQTIPKPSVPEFTLKYLDNNQSIRVKIYGQLPAYYNGDNNLTAWLYYNIQWKNHSATNWHIYSPDFRFLTGWGSKIKLVPASNSFISNEPVNNSSTHLSSFTTNVTYVLGQTYYNQTMDNFSAGQMIDFQVKAYFGYYTLIDYNDYWEFISNESAWSPTKTITILASNPSSPTSTVREFPATLAITFLIMTALAVVVVSRRKHLTAYS